MVIYLSNSGETVMGRNFNPRDSARELLNQTTRNPNRKVFGLGNATTSVFATFAPYIAAKMCGNTSGLIALGYDAVFLAGAISAAARNCPYNVNFFGIFDHGLDDVSYEAAFDSAPRAVSIEYAKVAGARLDATAPMIGRVFRAGLWNGLKRNGLVKGYEVAIKWGGAALMLAAAGVVSCVDFIKSINFEKHGLDPSLATERDFIDYADANLTALGKVAKAITIPPTRRDREHAIDSVEALIVSHRDYVSGMAPR